MELRTADSIGALMTRTLEPKFNVRLPTMRGCERSKEPSCTIRVGEFWHVTAAARVQ